MSHYNYSSYGKIWMYWLLILVGLFNFIPMVLIFSGRTINISLEPWAHFNMSRVCASPWVLSCWFLSLIRQEIAWSFYVRQKHKRIQRLLNQGHTKDAYRRNWLTGVALPGAWRLICSNPTCIYVFLSWCRWFIPCVSLYVCVSAKNVLTLNLCKWMQSVGCVLNAKQGCWYFLIKHVCDWSCDGELLHFDWVPDLSCWQRGHI